MYHSLGFKNDADHESLKQHNSWKASWQFFPLLIPSQQFPTHPHRLIPHYWTHIPGYTSSLSGTWSSHMYLYRQDAHGDTQRETVYTHPDLGVTRQWNEGLHVRDLQQSSERWQHSLRGYSDNEQQSVKAMNLTSASAIFINKKSMSTLQKMHKGIIT